MNSSQPAAPAPVPDGHAPDADADAPAAPAPAACPPAARVLVVDDEQDIRDLLTGIFRLVGLEVAVAGSGVEALNTARAFRPDLVVLDVTLPDLDGFEVARLLRRDGSGVPVLFLTAYDGARDRPAEPVTGDDDCVAKPFALEEVVLRIRAMLRRNQPAGTAQRRPDP